MCVYVYVERNKLIKQNFTWIHLCKNAYLHALPSVSTNACVHICVCVHKYVWICAGMQFLPSRTHSPLMPIHSLFSYCFTATRVARVHRNLCVVSATKEFIVAVAAISKTLTNDSDDNLQYTIRPRLLTHSILICIHK